MVTHESTQVLDLKFAFYGPMGFDIRAFLGNLILAFCAQDGHADQVNDRKEWILRTIEDTWNLFNKKFIALWDEHKDGSGEAYLPAIYNNPELQQLVQQKFMEDLFHDTLGFGAAKMIRRIVDVAHVEDLNQSLILADEQIVNTGLLKWQSCFSRKGENSMPLLKLFQPFNNSSHN